MKTHDSEGPELTEWQIERIEEAKKQLKNENCLTNEQADKLVEKWLSK